MLCVKRKEYTHARNLYRFAFERKTKYNEVNFWRTPTRGNIWSGLEGSCQLAERENISERDRELVRET